MWHHQKQQRYIPPSSSSSSSLRTMEEVWKDITLNASSPITENATQQTYFHRQVPSGLTISHFRDFLPRTTGPISGSVQLAPPPPATILSLNSGTDSQFLKTIIPLKENHSSSSTSSTCSSSCSPSSALSVLCNNKKRCPPQQLRDPGSDDGRNKRMIKNRESAARSRARKQAYTNELEMEVSHLTEENETLRRQHEELRAKMAAQMSTKRALQRSSTAPF